MQKVKPSRKSFLSDELANDPEFLALVAEFVKGLPHQVSTITDAVDEKNWEVVEKVSHNLKGVGGNYGFPEISEIAANINNDMKKSILDRIEHLAGELKQECERIQSDESRRRAS